MADTENSETRLTELQFTILDGMADDYEDVEQLYLFANREFAAERELNVQPPRMLVQTRVPLRDLMDEIAKMVRQGYVEAKHTNDEQSAPFRPLNFEALYHYWFAATHKGQQAWKRHPTGEALNDEQAQ